ncbi:MAG: DUF2141 domain-containing protein [Bacteroidia bacterium]
MCFRLVLFSLLFAFHLPVLAQQQLFVQVTNIKDHSGKNINCGLFRAGDQFPARESVWKYQIKAAHGDTLILRFDIPFGAYAIGVSHDLNGNGQLDRNIFGYPSEPFGFSRNFKPRFSAPTFEDCSFRFEKNNQLIRIRLID